MNTPTNYAGSPHPDHTRFYRDKANGKFMGVCAGLADYTGVDVLWFRIGAIIAASITGGAVIPAYFLTGMFAAKKPAHLYVDSDEQRYWQGVRQSPQRTTREVRATFREIDRRLAAVEAHYVSSNPRLADEIEALR